MVSSKFDSLSVRPPTPPKDLHDHDHVDETLQFLDDPFGEKPTLPSVSIARAVLNTPQQSPSSDISIPSSAASARKRVNFELKTCPAPTNKAVAQSWTPSRSSPLRPLPQTRVSKPLKSILKPSEGTPTPSPHDQSAVAHQFKTFPEMLESIVKLLASSERSSRLDAYHSLQRTMQAYDNTPDPQALKNKMSLLLQFIRRDIQAPGVSGTGTDSQLITQALKLLMALFRAADVAATMDDDFCSFIIERIITVASNGSMPKTVVNTHLAVLMQQNFRPRTMTTARMDKILDVLDTIHERVSGFSVQAYRIRIYKKLVLQRPEIMIKHTERWFKHVLKSFMTGQKDIHQSALDTTICAARTIGHDRNVAKSVISVLNRVRHDGDTIAKVMTQELEKMLGGENAGIVPQIWSAVTSLLRDCMHTNLFSAMKEWLNLFEKFLKSDNEQVRVHANVSFGCLVYAVNVGANTGEGWTRMCINVPLQQLQRNLPMKKAEWDATTSGYFTLLYYAIRPTASFEQLDRYWKEFVAAFWSPLIHSSPTRNTIAACRIVSALLNGSRKPWAEHRALDLRPHLMIQRGELPLLDPKWVRKSLALILQFVETLLDATSWSESNKYEDEPVKTMWISVLDSLAEASSKEVMASSETKDAIANIINLLRRLWERQTAKLAVPQQKEDLWADKFCFLIQTMVQKLSPLQFSDKCLVRNSNNEFEVASTPSHRSRQQVTRTSSLLYLIDLLVDESEGRLADTVRLRALSLIIEPCFNAQRSRLARLDLLRDCAAAVDGSSTTTVVLHFWDQIAGLLRSSVQDEASDPNERSSRSLGKEYETVVDIMALGSTYFLSTSRGLELLSTLIEVVRQEAGEGALILAVIEKVSELVLKRTKEFEKISCLTYTSALLRNLPRQMSRRVLDQGRQKLWPSSPAAVRNPDFDPYSHLYGAVVSVGTAAYRDFKSEDVQSTKGFIEALSNSIQQCSTSHLAVYLRKSQEVIRIWVEDSGQKMQTKQQPVKDLHCEVVNMWKEVNKAIERLPRKDSQILLHLEPLIAAGFLSTRRSIVNISITTWNKTFGQEESLRYPARLEQALHRLRGSVSISLPSFVEQDKETHNDLVFYDSDSSNEEIRHPFASPRAKKSPFKVKKDTRRSISQSPAVSNKRVSARHTPKVRLRHDNSQIQFEPIVSSPSNPFNQESQILTERQKEMIERQRRTTGLFTNIGAVSPQPDAPQSPLEINSDAVDADDLPDQSFRTTPRKALAAMGPMDVFLGSSPTPHARKTTRQIANDNSSVATPTAVRIVLVAGSDDFGSSPPRMERTTASVETNKGVDVLVGSSFDYGQREPSHLMSFEGTTIDEDALPEVPAFKPQEDEEPEDVAMTDPIVSEPPSSAVNLQLTAQIDAEIQAQIDAASSPQTKGPTTEPLLEDKDARSQQQSPVIQLEEQNSDMEVEDSQLSSQAAVIVSDDEPEVDMISTNRVRDSFNKPFSDNGTPKAQSLRRSSRQSILSSPVQPSSGKRRKRTPNHSASAISKKSKEDARKEEVESNEVSDDEDLLDNIVVDVSMRKDHGKKRKSLSNSESLTKEKVLVPETIRKRGIRRSQSLLSQVENSQDTTVDDTPAPKRTRKSLSRDVSEAQEPLSADSQGVPPKRLSHVQITPKRSAAAESKEAVTANLNTETATSTSTPNQTPRKRTRDHSQHAPTETSTPSQSFAERVILTPRSIINQLKSLKAYLFNTPQLRLGREEEREIDDELFDIRRELHAAGRRGEESRQE